MNDLTWVSPASTTLQYRLYGYINRIACVEYVTFRKLVDKTGTVWVADKCNHILQSQSYVSFLSGLLTRLNPNNFVARPWVEPAFIKSHKILQVARLCKLEESEYFISSIISNFGLSVSQAVVSHLKMRETES
jgi:hypothetical protein